MSPGYVAPCYLCDRKFTWPPGWEPGMLKVYQDCRHIHYPKPEPVKAPEPDPTPPSPPPGYYRDSDGLFYRR